MDPIQTKQNQEVQNAQTTALPNTMQQIGEVELSLNVFEYAPHERSTRWVYMMIGTAIVLAIGFIFFEGISSFSFIAALIALMVVYYQIHGSSSPNDMMDVSLTNFGIMNGNRFTPYSEVIFYYIHSFPTHNTLNFAVKGTRKIDQVIYLPKEIDFTGIRETLKNHEIAENFEIKENILDYLIRLLKL